MSLEYNELRDAQLGLERERNATNGELKPPRGILITASSIEPERVEWYWQARIPLGKITMMDGDPDRGKTLITIDVAARSTSGREMPDGSPSCDGDVIILTAEDDLSDTMRPRLDAAGADIDRVHFMTGIRNQNGKVTSFSLPGGVDDLAETIDRVGARLVIIDPIMAFLGGRTDSGRDDSVRREAMSPLKKVAEDTRAAIVCIRHLNKMVGTRAIHRGGGSVAFIAAVRSAMLVAPHPEDETLNVLAVIKSNLARKPSALTYRIVPFQDDPEIPRVQWEGTIETTADELLAAQAETGEERGAIDDAAYFLRETLTTGRVPSKAVYREAKSQGISGRTLERAKQKLGVDSVKVEDTWYWILKAVK